MGKEQRIAPVDIKTGHNGVTGRLLDNGTFELQIFTLPDHGHQAGEDIEPERDLGPPAVHLIIHDVRVCDSFSLAIRQARKALESVQ